MRAFALWLVISVGLIVVGVSTHYALQDWAALNREYARFEASVRDGGGLAQLIATEGLQNAFRLNVFADGTWVLLGAILAAIGVHGLCVMPRRPPGEAG